MQRGIKSRGLKEQKSVKSQLSYEELQTQFMKV